MFEYMTQHNVILVSGPQRSGTRAAAKMIATDTGHRYVDENEFKVYSRKRLYPIMRQGKVVIQCPALSHIVHEIATDEMLVVFMIRNLEDIVASERRINWNGGPYIEMKNYGLSRQAAKRYRRHGGQVAPLKYAYWWGYQRERVQHWMELEYESLAEHPLWVPKTQRVDFEASQTEIS